MLRISSTISKSVTTIHLQGKFLTPWLAEFEAALAEAMSAGTVEIDLANLSFADSDGIAALNALRARGTTFLHASPFIESLLALQTA